MAADKITYADKVGVTPKETHINQVWDDDMNEIKLKLNNNADLLDVVEQETDINTLDILDLQTNSAQNDNVVTKIANYTAIANDYVLVNATSLAITITLPTAIGIAGRRENVTKTDTTSNKVTINTSLSQTINGSLTIVITGQYDNVTLISDGANWVIN